MIQRVASSALLLLVCSLLIGADPLGIPGRPELAQNSDTADPGLPVVDATADLAPPFDEHTGRDILVALRERCSPGCIVRLEAATYRDFELQFTREDAARYTRLVIEGTSQAGSIVQPKWPTTSAGCDGYSQIQFHFVPSRGLELRNFTIDGRKDEIPAHLDWEHCKTDLVLLSFSNIYDRNQSGIVVHHLTLIDGAGNGLWLREVENAVVHHITARNMGCNLRETAANGAATDHGCRLPKLPTGTVTRKANASDSVVITCSHGADGCEVRDSLIDGATKAGIECFHALRCHFRSNTVRHVYGSGIVAHNSQSAQDHGIEVIIEDNLIEHGGFSQVTGPNVGNGISVTFSGERFFVRRNEIKNNQGAGIVFDPVVWVTTAVLDNNTLEGNCTGPNRCYELMVGRRYNRNITRLTSSSGNRITAGAGAFAALNFTEVADALFGSGNVVDATSTRSGWAVVVDKGVSGLTIDGATIRAGDQGGIRFEADATRSTVTSQTAIETTGSRCQDRNGSNVLPSPPC